VDGPFLLLSATWMGAQMKEMELPTGAAAEANPALAFGAKVIFSFTRPICKDGATLI